MSTSAVSVQMHEEILALAKTLCSGAEESRLERLCEACEAEVAAKLRAGVSTEQCEAAFICAAAWLAAAYYESAEGSDGIVSLRAGEMSVTAAGADRRSARCDLLRRSARALMEPYCRETAFSFQGVQG